MRYLWIACGAIMALLGVSCSGCVKKNQLCSYNEINRPCFTEKIEVCFDEKCIERAKKKAREKIEQEKEYH